MRLGTLTRFLFILYCIDAGVLLLLAPWSLTWDRLALELPLGLLRGLFLHPVARGAVSGFGLVHLVWGAHDLDALLARRRGHDGLA